jgi:hypothetical protein
MATLAELKEIYDNTILDIGDPPDPDVVAAHDLLAKFEAAIWRRANFYLDDEANDTTPGKVKVAWSSRASADSATMARTMLRLALGSEAGRTATVTQIFAQNDQQLENIVDRMIPLFAAGILISR